MEIIGLEAEISFTNELLKFVPGKQYVIMAFDLTREGCANIIHGFTALPRYSHNSVRFGNNPEG